jgi:hypothetical protein
MGGSPGLQDRLRASCKERPAKDGAKFGREMMPDHLIPTHSMAAGQPDHDHVTADQTTEIAALMAKHKKTQKQVLDAIKKKGPLRVQIERALRK